jgi:hypothetical protein
LDHTVRIHKNSMDSRVKIDEEGYKTLLASSLKVHDLLADHIIKCHLGIYVM